MPSQVIVSLGVRLTDDAWHNFQGACLRSGLTVRSALEAAVEIASLFAMSPAQRRVAVPHLAGPLLEELAYAAWPVVEQLAIRHRTSRERKHKITIRTEASRLEALRKTLEDRGLTLNATLAAVFTPWGSGWGDPAAYQLRLDVWEWAAEQARARDYVRRRGARGTAIGTPAS